jgi:hypothetical protein
MDGTRDTVKQSIGQRDHRVRCARFVVATLLAASVVGACGSSSDSTPDDGLVAPKQRDGGIEVTVPALWADTRQGVSGIEPAKVWVNAQGSGQFEVDLNDIEAEGAGDSWRAASASAAVVGTMVSGVSPAGVDINFAVTGPINGPSAGGILTMAIMAALLDSPLRADVTMTGTITADGSLGKIGGVELKLQAAAKAGYRTVLLPPANMTVRRAANGEDVSATVLGAELGVEVIEVANIQQAFSLFRDEVFGYPDLPAYELPASVMAAAQATTDAQIALIEADLAAASPGVRNDERLVAALATVTTARDQNDLPTAYGLGVDAILQVRRRLADEAMTQSLNANGAAGATRALRDQTTALLDRTRNVISDALDEAQGLGYEQMLSAIPALGWPVYAQGVLGVLQRDLGTTSTPTGLSEAARLLSDLGTNVDVQFPHAISVVRAMPTRPVGEAADMAEYLSIYADFLMRAAEANEVYARDVLLGGTDLEQAADQRQVLSLLPIVVQLGNDARAAVQPGIGTVRQELEQVAYSFTYYVGVLSLVASLQAFGIDDFRFANDTIYVASPDALTASVTLAKFAVDEIAKYLASQGLDAGYAVWTAQWGTAAYQALATTGRGGVGAVLALEELWFDVLNVFMLQTGPVALSGS